MKSFLRFIPTLFFLITALSESALAQVPAAQKLTPNLIGKIDHPLRYRPDGGDFIIENGAEFFNRPLYGGPTAFRVDAGDRPEFTLYLPGRGGNLRFGLKSAKDVKWLHDATHVVARYRPGEMLYEIRDDLLGALGRVQLHVIAMPMTEGLIVRVEADHVIDGVELLWAYGGVNGQRGKRDGDIGTESVPISTYFQLQPEFCRGNAFSLRADSFTLNSKAAKIVGLVPKGAQLALADARAWSSAERLFAHGELPNNPELAVVIGRMALKTNTSFLFALQRVKDGTAAVSAELDTYRAVTAERSVAKTKSVPISLHLLPAFEQTDLPRLFLESAAYFKALRTHLSVDTPDPYLNAAVASLNVAADAVWDAPQGDIMHGAIAWRSRLLGWRGPYALDALGWHERARQHFIYWAGRQNLDPIPQKLPLPDESTNLARNEAALHSNGDLSNTHYDMNLVAIDALFRHLRWTGDLEFARTMWPVIERHLAWERRLFRREFGPDKLPLYEAYAVIWASDDLQYHGGGTAHASAYNYWHNQMAAQLARLLGKDATLYAREADLIGRAMRTFLWLGDKGTFAEYKDLLGNQLVHPSAALWSVYHIIDSEMTTPEEAWQLTRYVDTQIPHLPVHGLAVPQDINYQVLASSDWMPYTWSINNVVMGENIHTALAYWQTGRAEEAFGLTKAALLASMFMGVTPGNVGSMNYLDVYRRESQRDFADGSGVLSRAVVEGLFGVKPDVLKGELRIEPGFPATWEMAKLRHTDISLSFSRIGMRDTYLLEQRFSKQMAVRLKLPAQRDHIVGVTIDGVAARWRLSDASIGSAFVEIAATAADRHEIIVTWGGDRLIKNEQIFSKEGVGSKARISKAVAGDGLTHLAQGEMKWSVPRDHVIVAHEIVQKYPPMFDAHYAEVDLTTQFNDRITQIFKNEYRSPRSPFVSLALPKQGIGAWAGHVHATAEIDDSGLRTTAGANGGKLMLPNGVPLRTPGPDVTRNIAFVSQWDNYPHAITTSLSGRARHVWLLMAGSTNWMQSRIDNGEVIVNYADGTSERLALRNPETWWPIDQDYFVDDYQFRIEGALPMRVDLKSGKVRVLDFPTFKGQGRTIEGGAATVLDLPLDPHKDLSTITVRALANEVVIGLMSVTLAR